MSRSDDGRTHQGLRDWLMVSFTMVIPLAWVGTQAADEPLYEVNHSAMPAHASQVATQVAPHDDGMGAGIHASLLGDVFRLKGVSDARALLSLTGGSAGYNVPLVTDAHGKVVGTVGKGDHRIKLHSVVTQEHQLAVTDLR